MSTSWITREPNWYIQERELLTKHYPDFRVDQTLLAQGYLVLYGSLTVRPPGGSHTYHVSLEYPEATPYEHAMVTPLVSAPEWKADGSGPKSKPKALFLDRRHQMLDGHLCLFQRDTTTSGGDPMDVRHILRRAENWLKGHHTGRWPPDTAESELEAHFDRAGDVLLANTFYDTALGLYGRFFFSRDLRRVRDGDYEIIAPLVITCATKENGLIQAFDARGELSRLFPWIESERWSAAKEASKPGFDPNDKSLIERGYWWGLPTEPEPFRDGAGLLKQLAPLAPDGDAWALINSAVKSDIASDLLHVAMRYPARGGGVEWLFLIVLNPQKKAGGAPVVATDAERRRRFEEASVFCLKVSRLDPTTLQFRNTGVVDVGVREQCVALIGIGALGSEVAELLAKAGVGHFRICDFGRLEPGNAVRHVGGVSQFGASKATVVAARLIDINPYITFNADDVLRKSASRNLSELSRFIEPADVVICTTADENVEAVVNQCAIMARKPVLYGRALHDASLGRVFLVRPGVDACKACLAGYITAKRDGHPVPADLIDVPDDASKPLLHECGRPVIAGSGIDLSFTSSLIARVALDFLEGTNSPTNHWLWTGRPAPTIDPRLSTSLSTVVGTVPPDPSCPLCQEPAVRELRVPDDVRGFMEREVVASPNRETGGVLIGYIDGHRAIVTRATGPGPNAERSKTIFRRDVPFVQAELDKAAAELGPKGLYIGEWHSHLSTDVRPSATDIDSLVGISNAPHYLTCCPVMIILGLDAKGRRVGSVSASAFPLGGRMFSIPLVVAGTGDTSSCPVIIKPGA